MQREPVAAVLPWLERLNGIHGSYDKFLTSLNVFTTGTAPCQICTIVDTNVDDDDTSRKEAYKQLCDRALHMPLCASSTILITRSFLEIYKPSSSPSAFTPIHIAYHFQLNMCHANCCANVDWTHRAAAMAVLGKAIKMIAQDAEFSRRAEQYDADEDSDGVDSDDDAMNHMSISCRDVMDLLSEYKSTVLKKCSCRLLLQQRQTDCKEESGYAKEIAPWCSDKLAGYLCKKERFKYLTTLADPRESFKALHGSQKTKTECELCNLWPWHRSEFEQFEVAYQTHKCFTGKPINALFRAYASQGGLATTINVGKDHLCKHYITDPLCAFNRCIVNTTHRPCVVALVAAFLYKLAQRCGKDLEAKKTIQVLDVLSAHYLVQHKEIQSEIW